MSVKVNKRSLGQYFTRNPIWFDNIVEDYIAGCNRVVDPFAGGGDILALFPHTLGYDIDPTLGWTVNDSLVSIPRGEPGDLCITNPPYLARNSATRRGIPFKGHPYDDLYLRAIGQCLYSFDRVVALIPESFLLNDHFKERLAWVNIIEADLFDDTDCPVLLAGWGKDETKDFIVRKNGVLLGPWSNLNQTVPTTLNEPMRFNDPDGDLGLICFDSTTAPSIRFCRGDEVDGVSPTGRSKTRISGSFEVNDALIARCNDLLDDLRRSSHDLMLSPFKGNMKDGRRRRRLDFTTARKIVNAAIEAGVV